MMKTVVPVILFVAMAGFHSVVSVSLESTESNESYEEIERTTQETHDELEYEAAHVEDIDSLEVSSEEDDEELDDGETVALTGTTENQEENTASQTAETDSEGYTSKYTADHNAQVGENVESRTTPSYFEDRAYYES